MRLIDITVDEVSLVDKAANKRQFVLIKRDEPKSETSKVEEKPKEEIKPEPEPMFDAETIASLKKIQEDLNEISETL